MPGTPTALFDASRFAALNFDDPPDAVLEDYCAKCGEHMLDCECEDTNDE